MNSKTIFLLFFVGLMITSCVPTQDLIYLQKKGTSTESSVTPVALKPYRLQTNDILSITINCINFIIYYHFQIRVRECSFSTRCS